VSRRAAFAAPALAWSALAAATGFSGVAVGATPSGARDGEQAAIAQASTASGNGRVVRGSGIGDSGNGLSLS
jgi:hypothetical protein